MRDEDMNRNMNKRGITLMELIIVMAIIAMGAVLMVPNIAAWLPNYRLRSATRDIASAMRVAQMKAVSSNVVYRVSFDDGNNNYVIQRSTGGLFVDEGGSQSLPTGISFNGVSFGGNKFVSFNPNSTASSGNAVVKNSKGTQKTISVLSTTGRVRID
jgi:prepilin-type N-terminal cleavage/methylation domain-containing protein